MRIHLLENSRSNYYCYFFCGPKTPPFISLPYSLLILWHQQFFNSISVYNIWFCHLFTVFPVSCPPFRDYIPVSMFSLYPSLFSLSTGLGKSSLVKSSSLPFCAPEPPPLPMPTVVSFQLMTTLISRGSVNLPGNSTFPSLLTHFFRWYCLLSSTRIIICYTNERTNETKWEVEKKNAI